MSVQDYYHVRNHFLLISLLIIFILNYSSTFSGTCTTCYETQALSIPNNNNVRTTTPSTANRKDSINYKIRSGKPNDESIIQKYMIQNFMNPLNIHHERFLLAVNPKNDSDIYGFVQLRPLSNNNSNNDDDNDDEIDTLWELASVYVLPNYRHQGIGSVLINTLLEKQNMRVKGDGDTPSLISKENIYFITLEKTMKWYEQFGFRVLNSNYNGYDSPPKEMKFELIAGGIVTKCLGEKLICMRGESSKR